MSKFMNDDEKIIELLKSLNKIEVPSNFDEKLFAKINPYENNIKVNFWEKFFSLPFVYSSSAAVIVASIILVVILINPVNNYNPFYELPKERENFVFTSSQQIDRFLNNEFSDEPKLRSEDIESDIAMPEQKQLNKSDEMSLEKSEITENVEEVERKKKIVDGKQDELKNELVLSTSSINQRKFLNFTAVSLTQEEKVIVDSLKNCLFKNLDSIKTKAKIEN
ncbi:MAG: hypothetical protein STSR0008_07110 [Ignavibacterium sp.]